MGWRREVGLTATSIQIWQIASLLVAVPEQRAQPVALPVCQAELVALSGQKIQLAVLPDLGLQPISNIGYEACSIAKFVKQI